MIRYNNISRPVHDPTTLCDPCDPTTPAPNLGRSRPLQPPGLTPLTQFYSDSVQLFILKEESCLHLCETLVKAARVSHKQCRPILCIVMRSLPIHRSPESTKMSIGIYLSINCPKHAISVYQDLSAIWLIKFLQ